MRRNIVRTDAFEESVAVLRRPRDARALAGGPHAVRSRPYRDLRQETGRELQADRAGRFLERFRG